MDIKPIIQSLEKHISNTRAERHSALNIWMDYMIDLFDISHFYTPDGFQKAILRKNEESHELMNATMEWLNLSANAIENGRSEDILGTVYEELFQSRGKASSLGQFFTPMNICDLMSKITFQEDSHNTRINDCACGSGRTLVSHFMEKLRKDDNPRKCYYVGEDIDISSVKMCALNMMIHGMQGRVIHHDTLKDPIYFDLGYEINEIRYPFLTPYYSIRKISYKKPQEVEQREQKLIREQHAQRAIKQIISQPDKDGQYSLF